MKKLEFETSKGRFLVEEASDNNLGRVLIKYITEQQASDIVDCMYIGRNRCKVYASYEQENQHQNTGYVYNSIESLHSLIKSKGYYLFDNPNPEPTELMFYKRKSDNLSWCDYLLQLHKEAEQKTFYNPVIFKIS